MQFSRTTTRNGSGQLALRASIKLALLAAASAAGAQEATTAEPLEEVVVTATGTHIAGFDAPTPRTTVSDEQLKQKAVDRVSDLIIDIPAFAANQNIGQTNVPVGASNFDLRGLGPARTLLLLDGRRVAPTEPTGTIDTNIIPVGLIKSLEIVTGGASAAYGSDAVSGVVNITLDDKYEGVKGDVRYGISMYDDNKSPGATLTAGRSFDDGRLHLVGSLDYFKDDGQLRQSTRPWGRSNYALITNPAGRPSRLMAAGATFSQLTNGGVAALTNPVALRGIQFGPGGTVLPFNYGKDVGTQFMVGGDGATMTGNANIMPQIERKSAFERVSFDITDKVRVFADALFADIDTYSDSAYASTNRGALAIALDNAFLPAQVRNLMVANHATTFALGRIIQEEGTTNTTTNDKVQRYGLGVQGEFGDTWHWDATGQFSKNNYHRYDGNNDNTVRFGLGVDSVINPATGQPICRALLKNPTSTNPDIANCVPINVFGNGSISPQALSYFTGTAWLNSQQKQSLFSVNLDGKPFNTWAGAVSMAVGGEYRKDTIGAAADAVSQQVVSPSTIGAWYATDPKPLSGSVNVKEGYLEADIPLLHDLPLAQSMDVDGAIRLTDYSTSGRVTTWKGGLNYSPIADLRIRATISRDIRAPSVNELYSGTNQFVNNVIDPRNNSNPVVPLLTGGNPNLTPEISKAWTAGLVYQPAWLEGFRASIDYYSFRITNAITSLSIQQIVDGCFKFNQTLLCKQINQNAAGTITSVTGTLLNAAASTSNGTDIELGYGHPLGTGKLDLRLLGNYVNQLTTTINSVTTDTVGQLGSIASGGIPKWRFVGSAHYIGRLYTGGVTVRYVDHGKYLTTYVQGIDIDNNSIASRTYVDLDMSRYVGRGFQVYAKINNVFNVFPPLAPSPITEPTYSGGAYADRIGRFYIVGARFQF